MTETDDEKKKLKPGMSRRVVRKPRKPKKVIDPDAPKKRGPTPNRPRSGPDTWPRGDASQMHEATRIDVDIEEVGRLTELGFSLKNIADVLDIHPRTLEKKLARYPDLQARVHKGRVNLKIKIRKKLLSVAMGGNTRVLLRISESLGVLDAPQVNLAGHDGGAIKHEHSADPGTWDEIESIMDGLTAIARAKAVDIPPLEVAGDGESEADTAAG